ncbi:hypothetical protein QMG83_00690 [Salinibacterium sp. G-O1]|uniref:hypothetical protein n=1 Tax=Salinibacterium sp. G-O1 TaxID=3046208 RepID=UPI0024BA196E|nr:hypothetical protein [Salinibacterium sp. G-O1]MDJ0333732.1 hypothetical protein [Salinibacterium sp. G-O1]
MTAIALHGTLALLAGLMLLQMLLMIGLPLGRYAWGGQHLVLPARLRVAAGLAIILYASFAAVLMSRGGLLDGGNSAPIIVGAWVLFGYAAFSVLPNVVSKSRKERVVQIPVSIALAIGIGIVAAIGVV